MWRDRNLVKFFCFSCRHMICPVKLAQEMPPLGGSVDVAMRMLVETYPRTAVEWAMKVQEIILRAMAKKISCRQAAGIIGISDHQMRRWRESYE
jgi:hypothetical protein